MDWTSEQDGLLRDLRDRGHSFSLIVQEFAARGFARTKGALVGRADRQKMPGLQRPSNKVQKRSGSIVSALLKLRARPAGVRVTGPNHDAPAGEFLGLTILELESDSCRYPQGDGEGIRFCGQPIVEGCSYCAKHKKLCFTGRM